MSWARVICSVLSLRPRIGVRGDGLETAVSGKWLVLPARMVIPRSTRDLKDCAALHHPWSSLPSVSSVCQSRQSVRRGTPRLYKAAHCLLTAYH